MRLTTKTIELHGEIASIRWRSKDDPPYVVGFLESGETIAGTAADGELVPGCPYRFFGEWNEHAKYGKQFKFAQFVKLEPHSRLGVVQYLARHCNGIGPAIAQRLWDAFGTDAVKVLRTDPVGAAGACGLSVEKAKAAAGVLVGMVATEDTKIELTNLFAGRGFPGELIDLCIIKWGILAPAHVKRDPFSLLVNDMPGCGFARCDRLYLDLGLDPGRLKRQVICLWHSVRSDTSGHTWLSQQVVERSLGETVSGTKVRVDAALRVGIRAGWLATRRDDAGWWWVADAERAANEAELAARLKGLAVA